MEIYTIKRNQIKMMRDRGYKLGETDKLILDMSREQFSNYIKDEGIEGLNESYLTKGLPKVYIYFSEDDINKKLAQSILETSNPSKYDNLILIVKDINNIKSEALNELSQNFSKIKINIFTYEKLLVRPTKHSFSPKYRKLSDAEKEAIIKEIPIRQMSILRSSDIREYKLENTQQRAKIFSDPIVEYLGLNPDDVVEITGSNFYLNILVKEYISYAYVK